MSNTKPLDEKSRLVFETLLNMVAETGECASMTLLLLQRNPREAYQCFDRLNQNLTDLYNVLSKVSGLGTPITEPPPRLVEAYDRAQAAGANTAPDTIRGGFRC